MSTKTKTEKFEKGAFYEDAKGNLWQCVNGKTRKAPDGNNVVDMKPAQDGHPTGEAAEEYTDSFVKKLSAKELKEYRDVAKREAESLADAEALKAEAGPNGDIPVGEPPAEAHAGETPAETKAAKVKKTPKAAKEPRERKLSALDAAVKVLGETGEPMSSKDLITAMASKGYWTSPGGQTPHATLYAAMIREMSTKGAESRFQKTDKGRFALAGTPVTTKKVATEKTDTKPAGKKATKSKKTTEAALPADGTPGPESVAELFRI